MNEDEHGDMLRYFRRLPKQPDMSPEAVTRRMELMGEICELSAKLGIPSIYYFIADYEDRLGRDN